MSAWEDFKNTLRRWFAKLYGNEAPAPSTEPKPEPEKAPPASTAPDEPDPSVEDVRKQGAALAAYTRAVNEWNAFLEDLSKGTGIAKEKLEGANEKLKTAGQVVSAAAAVATVAAAASAGASTVPIVGQVVAAVGALITMIAGLVNIFYGPKGLTQSEIDKGVNIINRGEAITGYREGVYRFNFIPIYGPKIDQFINRLDPDVRTHAFTKKQWESFYSLVKTFPYGPPVPRVDVLSDGTLQFEYNKSGNNDLSYEAGLRGERVQAETKEPEKITPKGTGDPPKQPPPTPGPARRFAPGPLPKDATWEQALLSGAAVVYEDEDFAGNAYVLPAGEYAWLEDSGIPNDTISSLRLPPRATIRVFENRDFTGASRDFYQPVAKVGEEWNDKISSARVWIATASQSPRFAAGPLPDNANPEDALRSGAALLYEHIDFGGRVFVLPPGEYSFVEDVGIPNDYITSIRVADGTYLQMFEDKDFGGMSRDIAWPVANLGDDWNDKLSSAKVRR